MAHSTTPSNCWVLLVVVLFLTAATVHGQKTNLFNGFRKKDGLISDIPTTQLSNDLPFPLVGLGVGNLAANRIESMVYEALQSSNKIRLVDTAHASRNEKQVAAGIVSGVKRFKTTQKLEERVQVHVVTKIWYTHLGYERTRLSVTESLKDLGEAIKDPDVDLKVHFLIHWPRCYDHIPWMNCEAEEANLPQSVRKLGELAPHLNKENAWKESWKALEDMYNSGDYHDIASIGISNFDRKDLETLVSQVARIQPHIAQINVWSVIHDPLLVEMLNRNNIHIQVYNVVNGIISNIFKNPNAHHHLLQAANILHSSSTSPNIPQTVSPAQAVFKWLIQSDISVIPRTSNIDHMAENSAVTMGALSNLNENQLEDVRKSVTAILSDKDLEDDVYVTVTFEAISQDMYVYFIAGENDLRQLAYVAKGDSHTESTHPHHRFRLFNAYNPDSYHDYEVGGRYGDEFKVPIEV